MSEMQAVVIHIIFLTKKLLTYSLSNMKIQYGMLDFMV